MKHKTKENNHTKIKIPEYLLYSKNGNVTLFQEFQTPMLNIKLNKIQIKELFHIVDLNNDKLIQSEEWTNFYELFAEPFIKCDEDQDLFLSLEETIKCIENDSKFENMIKFNTKWIEDKEQLLKKVFTAFDLNKDNFLNFYDYVMLRNFNNAYDVLLVKEEKVYHTNFAVGIHMICKKIKFYDYRDFVNIFNRTIPIAYFPHEEFMDFATFSTIGNLFKMFINTNHNTGGFLSYSDLLQVGGYTQTYQLIKDYTQLLVKNDLVYKNLNKGTKMQNLIYIDKNNITRRNFEFIKDNTDKISIEQMFLLYRHFDSLHSNNFTFPFSISKNKFENLLKINFFNNFSNVIDNSFDQFKKVSTSAEKEFEKKDYLNFIFNILDLNNSTFIEIYELLLARKVVNLFNTLQEDGKINNKQNDTNFIKNGIANFSQINVLNIDRSDHDYLAYINYKFNSGKINFHQFLFLFMNRLRNTSNLVAPEDITNYLNHFGFFINNATKDSFYKSYDIKPDDFLSFSLAIQKYFEFYSENL